VSGLRWLVSLVALAVLAAGCSSDEPRPRSEQRQAGAPTQAPESVARDPISKAKLARLAAFLKKVEFINRIGAGFELRDVQSPRPPMR
jgi:PBP1b-binding outer membrane lipoprotein LpoB